ncbi:MAG: hypothetical protein Q9181_000777 [Wetmoreana brouardii]
MAIEGVPEMKPAAQVVEYKKPYKIHTIPTPSSLSPYDLLLKVKVASLCHTDSMVSAGIFSTKLPCTASHEGCGQVVALGFSVTNFRKGDRVMAALPMHRCGHCADCLGPEEFRHYCPNLKGHVGITTDGAFGVPVVGVDARDEGLELAKSSGAHIVIDSRDGKEKVVEVKKVTDGNGVDSAITLSDAPKAAAMACAVTKMHGTMIQIAQPTEVSVPFAELIFRDIRIHGSLIAPRYEAQRMLDFVGEHGITVKTNAFLWT